MGRKTRLAAAAAALLAALLAATYWWLTRREPDPPARFACHAGAYRGADGRVVVITPLEGGLRYRLPTGETGRLERGAGSRWSATRGWTGAGPPSASAEIGDCGAEALVFALAGETPRRYVRERFGVRESAFDAGGTRLAGRLVLPPGEAPVPIAVLVHGSERYSGRAWYHDQHLFPAHGIGVFVYDKRGTGGSGGKYTQDFHVLARDAAAAAAEARRLAGARAGRVGLLGTSQGGWIAPLAATLAPVDFVVGAYGMLESPLAEDAGEVRQSLVDRGHGPEVLARARELTDATGRVMSRRSPESLAAFERVREKYRAEAWLADVRGEFTHVMLRLPTWAIPLVGPFFDVGTSWDYDPLPVQRSLRVPQLWVLAAEDREAPHEETLARLRMLQREGRDIAVALFPDADHGILEFEVREGERVSTRYAPGYFALLIDWIRDGRIGESYGRARLWRAPGGGRGA